MGACFCRDAQLASSGISDAGRICAAFGPGGHAPLESEGPIEAVAKLRSRKESRLLHLRNQKSGQPIYDETVKPFRFGATHV
jgi:hypothetical protein